MRARLAAARLILALGSSRPGAVRTATRALAGQESLRAWSYAPLRDGAAPTVLALHGLTRRGIDDPRMDAVCRALASAGCRVLAPELPDTARLRVGPGDVARVAALLDPAGHEPPRGVFAASFSASMALVAVARAPHEVRAVCAVGPCGDVGATVRHLVETADADPYGRVILFRNFGRGVLHWAPSVDAALDAWLIDDALAADAEDRPRWRLARAELSPSDTELVDAIVSGGRIASEATSAVIESAGPALRDLDVNRVADRIRTQVTLLHGMDDRVIPSAESVGLGRRIANAHLCLTPLLTHGDTRLDLGTLLYVPPLHRALTAWFSALFAA